MMKSLMLVCFSLGLVAASRDVCSQPQDSGPCKGLFYRYSYNQVTNQCERFVFGGCAGNDNNFQTVADCKARCQPETVDTCLQPEESGPCLAYFLRYRFDQQSGQCKQFVYGGCAGNDNNFQTLEQCTARCGHRQVKRSADRCHQPIITGLCKAAFPRFAYNAESGQCQRFTYGGCGGNDNNFNTAEECKFHCQPSAEEICRQPAATGMCMAYFPRFYFNHQSGRCESFVYGGCAGNDNNFKTVEECQSTCPALQARSPSKPSRCYEEAKEVSPCRAMMPAWSYNAATNSCEYFIYGGCGKSNNRFFNVEDCESTCVA